MKKLLWKQSILLLIIIVFLSSCKSSNTSISETASSTPIPASIPNVTQSDVSPVVTPAISPVPLARISEALTELYVGQEELDGSGSVGGALYNNDHTSLHTKPLHLAFHASKLYLFFSFKKNTKDILDNLLQQITLSPGVKYEVKETQTNTPNEVRYKMDIGTFDQELILRFGDTPEISIFKAVPMQIELADSTASQLLFHGGNALGLHLFLPLKYEFTLAFSEPIDQELSIIQPAQGTWIDDRHYKVKLAEKDLLNPMRMNINVKSLRGNKLAETDTLLTIHQITERQWMDYNLDKKIMNNPHLSLYDNLIFSPDKTSYIAITYLEGPIADEGGAYYGLVLEQSNKPAIIIENEFHIANPNLKIPVQWLDNHRFIYKTYKGIYTYDTVDGKKTNIISQPTNKNYYINEFTYDPYTEKLHVIWIHFGENAERSIYRHSIYSRLFDQQILDEAYMTESIDADKYQPLPLKMYPSEQGVYYTKVDNNKIQTVYVRQDGTKVIEQGNILTATSYGAYLLQEPAYGAQGYGDPTNRKLSYWEPGYSPIELALPTELAYFRAFGDELCAQSVDNPTNFYRLDLKLNKWFLMNKDGKKLFVPYNEVAIYREE